MKILIFFFRAVLLHFWCTGIFFCAYGQTINEPFPYDSHEEPEEPIKSSVIDLPDGYKIVVKNNLYKIRNENGETITATTFKKVGWANNPPTIINGYIGYKNNDLWGLIHLKSAETSTPRYTSVMPYEENLIIAAKREENTVLSKYGVINTSEKVIVPFQYNFLSGAEAQLIAAKSVEDKNRYGLINKKEGVIIPFIYKRITALSGGQLSVVNDENKAALFSNTGSQLTPFDFDSLLQLADGMHLIDKNGKKGILDKEGKLVVSASYKQIIKNDLGVLQGLPFSRWDLLSANNELLQSLAYDTLAAINKVLLKATIGQHEYLIDHKDHPVTQLKKRKFAEFHSGYAIFEEEDKFGAVANYSELIIPPIYDSIVHYPGFFVTRQQISKDHEWSIFNSNGQKINKISYDQIGEWGDGYFSVKKDNAWGFVNEYGHEVINTKFDSVFRFNEGIAKVLYKNKYAVIDKFGRYIVPPKFEELEIINPDIFLVRSYFNFAIYQKERGEIYQSYYPLYMDNGFIVEKTNSGKAGLFNGKGQRILTSEYDYLKVGFGGKLHVFGKDGKRGLLNLSGGILLGLEDGLEEVSMISEDFIGVKINKKYGFIDFDGKLRIANRYDSIGAYSESMAPINLLGRWGYIDKIERIKIQPKYQQVGSFKNETAIVGRKNLYGLINKKGKELIKIGYDKIVRNQFGNYTTYAGKKVGLVKSDGYEIMFPKYESVRDLGNGNMIVAKRGKFGLINDQGITTIPLSYDKLHYDGSNNLYFGLKTADWEDINVGQ